MDETITKKEAPLAENLGTTLLKAVGEHPSMASFGAFSSNPAHALLTGASGSQKALAASLVLSKETKPAILIVPTQKDILTWEEDLHFFLPDLDILSFPVVERADFAVTFSSKERLCDRMSALSALMEGRRSVILATAVEAAQKLPSPKALASKTIILHTGDVIERDPFLETLVSMGYERVDQVERAGHFSVRGDIIDIFTINEEHPVRIEFFDDEIDGIRSFNEDTQRSIENRDETSILPILMEETGDFSLCDYLEGGRVLLDEPQRGQKELKKYIKEEKEHINDVVPFDKLKKSALKNHVFIMTLIHGSLPGFTIGDIYPWHGQTMTNYQRQIPLFLNELDSLLSQNWIITIVIPRDSERKEIESFLTEAGVSFTDKLEPGKVTLASGVITGGFELPSMKLAVMAAGDILGRQKTRRYRSRTHGKQIRYFSDLNVGDYVVQATHGIGRYIGMRTIEIDGVHRDYVTIQYAGSDKLYLPMDRITTLEKYIGPEGTTPTLQKMGGAQWERIRSKASQSIRDLAERLLAVYAKREITPGIAFDKDNILQQEFEDGFPYVETPDQMAAIQQIKEAMERPVPMDMLLCGDVGFGKTEVAMRAVFKCVVSGYQALVLVPTTVLSQQHYRTFTARMNKFGVNVAVLNRFVTAKEHREILAKMKTGEIDVLIGTHSIISKKIKCHRLGLLVVDEEQRFGVVQKEKWKSWVSGIDILTLSATPIPRTLHMSLTGVRDMATITQAPSNRHAVQTYVTEYDDRIVREAILREKERHGQVYFVYNRIDTIDAMAAHLRKLLPEDVSIVIAHGRMEGKRLEQIMLDFYEKKFDVLLCTTLIENGLDQPNANTMLVYDADRMGLSQIYQMRGRVGRSDRIARAYFFYRKGKVLSEVAEKRLDAIREFTELGSGFKIAMRDLEIRGAGNLLGAQQHGNIASVGFATYCSMLQDAIEELKAKKENKPAPKKLPNTSVEFRQDAYIDSAYISNEEQKLEIYRRLAMAGTEAEVSDLLDEVIDRFGDPTPPVQRLFRTARLRTMARSLGVGSILDEGKSILVTWSDTSYIRGWNPMQLPRQILGNIHILPGSPSRVRIDKTALPQDFISWLAGFFDEIRKELKNSEKQTKQSVV
jgi:transcription-repair coupling factor (superfamily II helicase)